MSKKITIKLTDRRPVTIVAEDWPVIASASWFDNRHECQANHKAHVKVRQHADGRTIVYASLFAGPGGVHAGWRGVDCGYLSEASGTEKVAELVNNIHACAAAVGKPELADDCIADLPAEDLT